MRVRYYHIIVPLLLGILAVGVVLYGWESLQINNDVSPNDYFSALDYDETHYFDVGQHRAAIETQAFSITEGDNGPAKVIVSADDTEVSLDSVFNNDTFADLRPAYVSWQDMDSDRKLDLLIWTPSMDGNLYASKYISSNDGKIQTLAAPMQRPIPESQERWFF